MKKPITRMVVAIDGSEAATRALDYTLARQKCDAEVLIVSVVPPVESLMPRFTLTVPPIHYSLFIDS